MVRNFPLDFLRWVRNFPHAEFSSTQNPVPTPPPPLYGFLDCADAWSWQPSTTSAPWRMGCLWLESTKQWSGLEEGLTRLRPSFTWRYSRGRRA